MKLPVHHLRRAHAAVRHHAARVRQLVRQLADRSTIGLIPELTVLAVLVLLPFTYSPFNTDPHRFGATVLLLAGLTILCLSLALKYLVIIMKRRKGEEALAVPAGGSKLAAVTLIVFLLLLILSSASWRISLNSTLGGVGLALLFFGVTLKVTHLEGVKKAWLFALGLAFIFWLVFSSPLFTKIDEGLGQTKIFNAAWTQAKVLVRPQPLARTTPDYLTSLRVAVGSLINSPLKGSGLGHYANAFAMYRGAEFNRSTSWNLPFTHSASTLTDWVTEGGLLGLAIYLLLFLPGWVVTLRLVKSAKIRTVLVKDRPSLVSWGVAALAISSLFFSFPLADYVLYLTGLVIIGGDKVIDWRRLFSIIPAKTGIQWPGMTVLKISNFKLIKNLKLKIKNYSGTPLIRAGVALVVPALAIYLFVPLTLADHYFDQSRQVLNTDSAQPAYLLLQKAVATDPGNDTYHRAYAQLNLSLANAVGNTDQATAAKLVQQATREIKVAVSLNPENWDNQATAGTLYETLASAGPSTGTDAQTAEALAENSLLLAVKYNPFDPPSHLNLGGYYFFFKKDVTRAKAEVDKAIALKDDYADAHYALSVVYRQTGETAKAIEELKKVLTLFPAGSPNYNQVQSELQTLEATPKTPLPPPTPKTP